MVASCQSFAPHLHAAKCASQSLHDYGRMAYTYKTSALGTTRCCADAACTEYTATNPTICEAKPMELPKTILVPTDFSDCADEALEYALKLAKPLDATVRIMHAYLVPAAGWEGDWAPPPDMITQLEANIRAKLDAILSKAQRTLPSTTSTLFNGDPRDAVLKAAGDLNADLIVMGSHGRRGIARALLGSVTEHVLRRAPCAVLAIRQSTKK